MTSITQVSLALQTVLTTVANSAARTSGFIQRQRVLTGASWVQALVFGFLATPSASVEQLAHSAANAGTPISTQGLDQRWSAQAASCLKTVLEAAMQQVISADPVAIPILQRFNGVYLMDSTTISLPAVLAQVWRGWGGHSAAHATAALKVQVLWNLTTGAFRHLALQHGRANDRGSAAQREELPAGALRIADLGYFALCQFAALLRQGVYVLSYWAPRTVLLDAQGVRQDLVALLRKHGAAPLDLDVQVGLQERLGCRLLAVPVAQEVADQRRRRIRREAQRHGRTASAEQLALAGWTICLTTAPRDKLSVAEALVLLRARWQVELLFKLWKSHGQVDAWRTQQPWRILCEVYAKLLSLIVLHWVVLVSVWEFPNRSLTKVAQLVPPHALALGRAVATGGAAVAATLAHIQRCLRRGCRMNRRKKHPNTCQLLQMLTEGALT